jgi:ABC-type Mn2+/Zn2+ transport system permease subunit
MNFKPTKAKIIGTIIISFIISLFNFSRMIFGDLSPINYMNVILVWPISAIVIFIIWSLFEKK